MKHPLETIHLAQIPDFILGTALVRPSLSEVVGARFSTRLQPRVMQVLVALACRDGEVASRDDLVACCWGGAAVGDDALYRCVQRLRRLSAEVPGSFVVETFPRVGYRLIQFSDASMTLAGDDDADVAADVSPGDATVHPAPCPTDARASSPVVNNHALDEILHLRSTRMSTPRPRLVLAAGALAFIVAALVATLILKNPRPRDQERLIAVTALKVGAGDKAAETIREGLSSDLERVMLGRPARFIVTDESEHPGGLKSDQLVLQGNAATLDSTLHAQVQLRNASSGGILWAKDFSGDPAQADALRETIATKVGAELNCALNSRHQGSQPISDAAISLYLGACDRIGDYDLGAALDLLHQVVAVAPGFAQAWADVATTEAYTALDLPRGERAQVLRDAAADARRALVLDPNTGLAYYALSRTVLGLDNWDRRIAIVRQGLQVEPNSSELNIQLGQDLQTVGRSGEALTYLRRSVDLDPLNPVKTAVLISALAETGQLDEAEAVIRRANRVWPNNPMIWDQTFDAEAKVGDPAKALALLGDPRRPGMHDPEHLRLWQSVLQARIKRTSATVNAAVRSAEPKNAADVADDALLHAEVLTLLGKTDLAYRVLLAAVNSDDDEEAAFFTTYMAPLRADPRFMTLAKRQGLVRIWRSTGHWPDFCRPPHRPYNCVQTAEITSN